MTWPPPSIDPLIRRATSTQATQATQAEPPAPERPQPAPRPATRRKPVARLGRISSVALSVAATGGLTWSFAHADHQSEAETSGEPAASSPTPVTTGTTAPPSTEATVPVVVPAAGASPSTTTTVSSTTTTHAPTTTTAANRAATDGTFTGDAVPTRFGPVQVAVTYANGVITDVTATEYPSGNRRDRAINARALPALRQEVLTAQSARVHSVSGATYTSHAYVASLQAAIDAATAGG